MHVGEQGGTAARIFLNIYSNTGSSSLKRVILVSKSVRLQERGRKKKKKSCLVIFYGAEVKSIENLLLLLHPSPLFSPLLQLVFLPFPFSSYLKFPPPIKTKKLSRRSEHDTYTSGDVYRVFGANFGGLLISRSCVLFLSGLTI